MPLWSTTDVAMNHARNRVTLKDIVQIAVGACIMAFPVAAAEELWDLGRDLDGMRVFFFALASLFFLAVFIYVLHEHELGPEERWAFVLRVVSTYVVTLTICALLLLGLDQLPLFSEPAIAIKRSVLAAFPASFAATAIDSIADSRVS
jgi:uncharacterized membrane protein